MTALVALALFVVIALAGVRFGADSRPTEHDGADWQWPFHDRRA